jgi:hypothetical protein
MTICGMGGAGKTTIAAHAPNAFFFRDSLEAGIVIARDRKMVPSGVGDYVYTSWEDLKQKTQQFAKRQHDFDTYVLDATTGMQRELFNDTAEKHFDGSMERFNDFNKGPKDAANKYFPEYLDCLQECIDAGINVIVIAHSLVRPYKNPDGPDYDTWQPDLEGNAWQKLYRWVESSIFIHNETKNKEERKKVTRKVENSYEKIAVVNWSPVFHAAKNWYKVEGPIELGDSAEAGWTAISEAFGI